MIRVLAARFASEVCSQQPHVTTGHSRSKNGVASLAYDPVVHAEARP
jgi:hypothetical protein